MPNLPWDALSGGDVPQVSVIYSKTEYVVRQPNNPVAAYSASNWRSRSGCATTMLQESHQSPNRSLPAEQHIVTQFDVNAISLSLAADAAKQMNDVISSAANAAGKSVEQNAKKQPGPAL
jgi:hypothetical protein